MPTSEIETPEEADCAKQNSFLPITGEECWSACLLSGMQNATLSTHREIGRRRRDRLDPAMPEARKTYCTVSLSCETCLGASFSLSHEDIRRAHSSAQEGTGDSLPWSLPWECQKESSEDHGPRSRQTQEQQKHRVEQLERLSEGGIGKP